MSTFTNSHAVHNGLYRPNDKYPVLIGLPLIPLTQKEGDLLCHPDGTHPPCGVNVVFETFEFPGQRLLGETGCLTLDQSDKNQTRTVFVTVIGHEFRCFFPTEVTAWQLSEPAPCIFNNNY